MMKLYSFIFVLFISLNLYALEKQENTPQWKLGSEWIRDIQENDSKEWYTPFLKRLDKRYLKGIEAGEWNELLDQRERSKNLTLAEKRKMHEKQQQLANFKKSFNRLVESTNREFEKIILDSTDEQISKIVQEYIDFQDDPLITQLASDREFSEKCEALFEEIANEGEIKRYILYTFLEEIRSDKYEEYGVIIALQEYQKMLKLAESDQELKNYLKKSQEQYLKLAAKNHNYAYLTALSLGRIPLNSAIEQEVAHIMHNFLDDKRELMKKHRLLD